MTRTFRHGSSMSGSHQPVGRLDATNYPVTLGPSWHGSIGRPVAAHARPAHTWIRWGQPVSTPRACHGWEIHGVAPRRQVEMGATAVGRHGLSSCVRVLGSLARSPYACRPMDGMDVCIPASCVWEVREVGGPGEVIVSRMDVPVDAVAPPRRRHVCRHSSTSRGRQVGYNTYGGGHTCKPVLT